MQPDGVTAVAVFANKRPAPSPLLALKNLFLPSPNSPHVHNPPTGGGGQDTGSESGQEEGKEGGMGVEEGGGKVAV